MGQYILNVDKSGRITIPAHERKHKLPGDQLAVYVDVASIPGNDYMLSPYDCKCLTLITEDKFNEILAKTEALTDESHKRDMQDYFGRYASLQSVDSRGRIVLPKMFLQEVLAFIPPGWLELLVPLPGKARITTAVLLREAEVRTMKHLGIRV
jgi:DNA-binding transcriptional regulator/RsmH inhibitor MraZ